MKSQESDPTSSALGIFYTCFGEETYSLARYGEQEPCSVLTPLNIGGSNS